MTRGSPILTAMAHFNILVLEDDPNTRELVAQVLEEEGGFTVHSADTVADALKLIDKKEVDLCVVDRTLPDGDGLEFCASIRANTAYKSVPLLFVTARDSIEERVEGLRTGGDDYLTKPFNAAELLARVDALLRRSGRLGQPDTLEAGGIKLDLEARKVFVKGKGVKLWAKEFDLLALLVTQQGRVLSRDFLLQQVWDYSPGSDPSTKVVDVTVSHLREKLGAAAGKKVATVRGFGYRLDP
ncbi:MAG: DNA-binding response regulator [Elusimicrobia bacterium CG_4_9_14_3_um_filter_62_55]|nr:MAG: DNA-binding response regulator [Elusimicrobia bacterium CG22_combo_CG10-13_8_21_14_all_63_91]PJA17148.1 MAG: DNA-binding response regulator [Elusimicrobia bacterium CG_4_10_14_0_2_um_filter_63_34]PJB25644.1 MAG: DNA-binding response regulator [Elusimicrobia bacterium CG_4_9_14_3_um_filter_62_55]